MYIDALDYAKDVANRLGAFTQDQYFLRNERVIKELIDEEWPLATLGKILYHPNRIVEIEYYGKKSTSGYDASIKVTGGQKFIENWDDETPIEITTVYYKNAHLVREELAENGQSIGPSEIGRNDLGKVVSKCLGKNLDDDLDSFIPLVIDSLSKKYNRALAYPENCILVCALYAEKEPWIQQWQKIVSHIHKELAGKIKYRTILIDTLSCRHFSINKDS